jgi:hypothetical protein
LLKPRRLMTAPSSGRPEQARAWIAGLRPRRDRAALGPSEVRRAAGRRGPPRSRRSRPPDRQGVGRLRPGSVCRENGVVGQPSGGRAYADAEGADRVAMRSLGSNWRSGGASHAPQVTRRRRGGKKPSKPPTDLPSWRKTAAAGGGEAAADQAGFRALTSRARIGGQVAIRDVADHGDYAGLAPARCGLGQDGLRRGLVEAVERLSLDRGKGGAGGLPGLHGAHGGGGQGQVGAEARVAETRPMRRPRPSPVR